MKTFLLIMLMAMSSPAFAWTRTDTLKVTSDANDARVIGSTLATTGTIYNGKFDDGSYCSSIHRMQSLIPAGQTITSAIFEVRAYGITGTDTSYVMFEDANSPTMPSSGADFNSRVVTDSVQWIGGGTWTEGTRYQKTITTPFSTLYAAAKCDSGGYVNVFWKGRNAANANHYRTILGYDNDPTYVAYLIVTHETAATNKEVAIVVENTGAVGVDTMLYNALVNDLGYTCWYFDIDNVTSSPGTYNSAYFDTAADVWILVGSEAALPSATAQADSICNAPTAVVALGPDFWDEINLGIMDASDERSPENTGYLLNIGQTHWITKVFPDTIMIDAVTSRIYYNVLMPDSSHNIQSLIIDKDYKADTSRVLMCVADSGQTVFNTGTPAGGNVVLGRRAYIGLFQSTPTTMDSCQWWTIFERTVAWAAKDTVGNVLKRLCFSGKHELDWVSVVENSSGTDSIESYGNYDSNVGYDHDEKHFFAKAKNSAMQRKAASVYRALDVSRAYFNLRYEATSFTDYGGVPPTTWSGGFSLRPIIKKWQIERKNCFFSATCPNACWAYAWMDTAATPDVAYAWATGGARSTSDTRAIDYDTLVISESTTPNTYVTVDVEPDTLGGRMLDTLRNFGWATRMVHYTNSNSGGDNGEMTFFAPTTSNNRTPRLNILLSSFSTTVPTPTIAIATPEYDDDSVVFAGIYNQTFSKQSITISNSAGGALECATISENSGGWLYLVASGTNMPITLDVYMIGQAAGYRSATITITCADASNSPRTVKVASLLTSASGRRATGKEIWR